MKGDCAVGALGKARIEEIRCPVHRFEIVGENEGLDIILIDGAQNCF